METIMFWVQWILLAISVAFLLFSIYMLIRNERVFRVRRRVLRDPNYPLADNLERHDRLPDYDTMLWQLFRWNWNDYIQTNALD